MAFSKEQLRLNDDVFERRSFVPSLALRKKAGVFLGEQRNRTVQFAIASILEGQGWLALGSSVGYFSQDIYRRLQTQLVSTLRGGDFFRDRGYLFDPYWILIFKQMSEQKGPMFDEFATNRGVLADIFQSCLIRSLRMSHHPCVQASTILLNFDRPSEVEKFIGFPASFDGINESITRRIGPDIETGHISVESMYAGFSLTVHYLDTFRAAHGSSQVGLSAELVEVVSTLFRRIAQLEAWRFHFINRSSLIDLRDRFVKSYLEAMDIKDRAQQQTYEEFLKDLMEFFSKFETPRVSTSGAAQ